MDIMTGQDPCQRVINQLVGPSACHYSRTDDYLTMPDSESTSEPSVQVPGPCDQPEIKKAKTMVM